MSRSSVALDNLRAFVILVVLAFHSVLAYLDFLPAAPYQFNEPPYKWQSFAIIDSSRFIGFDLFCAYQDVYLMSLMFFLSGVFVWSSLKRKGAVNFLLDRLVRLGIPFALAIILLMPLTLYPTYSVTATDTSVEAYYRHYIALPLYPSGPQWFLWQLLTLNLIAALVFRLWPAGLKRLGDVAAAAAPYPGRFFLGLAAISAIGYVPLALIFNPWDWVQIGPFGIQESRPLHYAIYFFAGVAIGTTALDRGLLSPDGKLAQHWRAWLAAAIAAFFLWIGLTALTMDQNAPAPFAVRLIAALSFVIACPAACFATMAMFVRFATRRFPVAESLSDNAYGMYLVHYVFVVWLQYALLDVPLFAIAKATIVFIGTLLMSWATVAAIRSIPLGSRLVGERRAVVKAS
jgi:surface polysaccharide O-acyltransferase-like enzyme